MELHLNIIGFALIPLALIHVIFPKYFKWKEELKSLSLMNRQMMTVHTFFVALIVLLMGVLLVTSAHYIVSTKQGNHIALGFAIFWSARLLTQFFWYSSKLWKGKAFETIVHIVFSLAWVYLTVVFWWVWMG